HGRWSVSPVHKGRYLPDNCPPAECGGRLGINFPDSSACEEPADATRLDAAQTLVEVVERRAGRERGDDRLDAQRVAKIPGDLAGLDDEHRVPGVVAAAQVLHDEVELVA